MTKYKKGEEKHTETPENNISVEISSEEKIVYNKDVDMIKQRKEEQYEYELRQMLENYKQEGTNKSKANIVNQKGCSYRLDMPIVKNTFAMLEKYRLNGINLHYQEKQVYGIDDDMVFKSCLVFDFDIFQEMPESQIKEEYLYELSDLIMKKITHYIDMKLNSKKEHIVYVVCTKKPIPLYKEEYKLYKDGFHMIFFLKLDKPTKYFIFQKIIESDILNNVLGQCKIYPKPNIDKDNVKDEVGINGILDIGTMSNPIMIYGCNTKNKSDVYKISKIVKFAFDRHGNSNGTPIPVDLKEFSSKNLCYEFSLHFFDEKSVIQKNEFSVKQKYIEKVDKLENRANSNKEDDLTFEQQITELSITDFKVETIKRLLDIISIDRINDRNSWRNMIYALSNTSSKYLPLAHYVSMRGDPKKYIKEDVDKLWDESLNSNYSGQKLSLGSLYNWAREDNPEKHKEILKEDIMNHLRRLVIESSGDIKEYDIAKILYKLFGSKFKADIDPIVKGRGKGQRRFYELILPEDKHSHGELYKWKEDIAFDSLSTIIAEYLHDEFFYSMVKYLRMLRTKEDSETEIEQRKMNDKILARFSNTTRMLKSHNFKQNIIKECQLVFKEPGFTNSLDQDGNIIGVGNGIVVLGKKNKFINTYHEFPITLTTQTNYVPYDKHNLYQKRLKKAYKALFPKNEHDAYKYCMYFFARSLDGKPKPTEGMTMCIYGGGANGKTFLSEMHSNALGSQYATKGKSEYLTERPSASNSPDEVLMAMKNCRYARFSEFENSTELNIARFKELTGNESLFGRGLYSSAEQFILKCTFTFITNSPLVILTSEHAFWRRWTAYIFKHKFVKNPDPNKPMEKQANSDMMDKWVHDPKYLEAHLAIMLHYYEKLQTKYGGELYRIDAPTIVKETENYRNEQDLINKFVTERIIEDKDAIEEYTIPSIARLYEQWYKAISQQTNRLIIKDIIRNLNNSRLESFLTRKQYTNELILKGYRILNAYQPLESNDKTIGILIEEKRKAKIQNEIGTSIETNKDKPLDKVKKEKKKHHKKEENDTDTENNEIINLTSNKTYNDDTGDIDEIIEDNDTSNDIDSEIDEEKCEEDIYDDDEE